MRWFYKLFTMCSLLLTKDKPQFRPLKNLLLKKPLYDRKGIVDQK